MGAKGLTAPFILPKNRKGKERKQKGSEKKMKSTTKQPTKQSTTRKATKATKKHITALLLALLLTAVTLSSMMPVKAQNTATEYADTTENDSDRDGGGHQTGTGGDGEISGGRPTGNDASFSNYIHCKYKSPVFGGMEDELTVSTYIKGDGHFNVRTIEHKNSSNNRTDYIVYVFSDKPFSLKATLTKITDNTPVNNSKFQDVECTQLKDFGNSSYYYVDYNIAAYYNCEIISIDMPNLKTFTETIDSMSDDVEVMIESTLDLTKDDYKEPEETSAVYNKNLDFASISADYKVKYTIEKNNDGHFEFITPDEAGIQFDWTNRVDIDGAYVKFTLYGEYYDSFWSTSYTNTYVTFICDRKNDLTYLCKQKDMISMAKEKCNGSNGYGFVVNYVYVQAFANIDGKMCRSRIYKFDSDLVSDYGNADSEDDEWFPEMTGGDSMPEDYEPDPNNPDPEKTEPEPDKDDDTVVDTPIKYDPDVVINDDTTYLEAFKQFINVMKQGISYLGDFPLMISQVFSFFPPIYIAFIGIGFAVALILRFLGR